MMITWWRSLPGPSQVAVVLAGLLMVSNAVFAIFDLESRISDSPHLARFLFYPDRVRLAHAVAAGGSALLFLAIGRLYRLVCARSENR